MEDGRSTRAVGDQTAPSLRVTSKLGRAIRWNKEIVAATALFLAYSPHGEWHKRVKKGC